MRLEGYNAVAFASAEEFLNSDHLNDTACLILDFGLPAMTGLDLQKYLAKIKKPIPIIYVSGLSNKRAQALEAGAFAFLSKPFDVRVLVSAVNGILGQKIVSNV